MPLYLGLDATTHGLNAIVIEIESDVRRVVFSRTLNFDRDLPHYGTTGGLRRTSEGDLHASPVMWADALDRVLGRLAAAAEIEVERIQAISGSAHELDGDTLHQHLPDAKTINPSIALATQLKAASPIARRFESLGAYFEALIAGTDVRLSPYWRKRFALPPAAIVPWTNDQAACAIGTGIIRDGVIGVSFGTNDTVTGCATDVAPRASRLTFRNGALARELQRIEYRLDWDDIAELLEARPGNDGWVMLPWAEIETTPPVAHAGIRRFGFDRHDSARNVRGLIEGQLMAMANHASSISGGSIEKVIATGDAAAHRPILQVMANVFGAEVYRLDTELSGALGAALRAYHADRLSAGEPVTWKTAVSGFTDPKPGHRVSPNPKHVAIYERLRRDYAMLERIHQDRPPIC
jgi:sugar (pentulose or hexulose) kinase